MRSLLIAAQCVLVVVWLTGLSGCGTKQANAPAGSVAESHDHAHDHAHEGPHGGHIIELGSETHHAELTHDDATHKVGIYLLDRSTQEQELAPIAAEAVTINVAVDGTPTQYILPAVRQPEVAAGQASYFELVSEPLCTIVSGESEAPNSTARVSITIDDKPFVGIIETEPHDHGHDHAH